MRGREESRVKRLGGGEEEERGEAEKEEEEGKEEAQGKGVVAKRCGWTRGAKTDSLTLRGKLIKENLNRDSK